MDHFIIEDEKVVNCVIFKQKYSLNNMMGYQCTYFFLETRFIGVNVIKRNIFLNNTIPLNAVF